MPFGVVGQQRIILEIVREGRRDVVELRLGILDVETKIAAQVRPLAVDIGRDLRAVDADRDRVALLDDQEVMPNAEGCEGL